MAAHRHVHGAKQSHHLVAGDAEFTRHVVHPKLTHAVLPLLTSLLRPALARAREYRSRARDPQCRSLPSTPVLLLRQVLPHSGPPHTSRAGPRGAGRLLPGCAATRRARRQPMLICSVTLRLAPAARRSPPAVRERQGRSGRGASVRLRRPRGHRCAAGPLRCRSVAGCRRRLAWRLSARRAARDVLCRELVDDGHDPIRFLWRDPRKP